MGENVQAANSEILSFYNSNASEQLERYTDLYDVCNFTGSENESFEL